MGDRHPTVTAKRDSLAPLCTGNQLILMVDFKSQLLSSRILQFYLQQKADTRGKGDRWNGDA